MFFDMKYSTYFKILSYILMYCFIFNFVIINTAHNKSIISVWSLLSYPHYRNIITFSHNSYDTGNIENSEFT